MDYNKIDFNDEFDDDDEVCGVCGHDAMPPVGYNEEKDLLKFECPECGAIFIQDGDFNTTMVKGEARKWGKFLAENLELPRLSSLRLASRISSAKNAEGLSNTRTC